MNAKVWVNSPSEKVIFLGFFSLFFLLSAVHTVIQNPASIVKSLILFSFSGMYFMMSYDFAKVFIKGDKSRLNNLYINFYRVIISVMTYIRGVGLPIRMKWWLMLVAGAVVLFAEKIFPNFIIPILLIAIIYTICVNIWEANNADENSELDAEALYSIACLFGLIIVCGIVW